MDQAMRYDIPDGRFAAGIAVFVALLIGLPILTSILRIDWGLWSYLSLLITMLVPWAIFYLPVRSRRAQTG